MKPHYESAEHQAIREIKKPLIVEARKLLSGNLQVKLSDNFHQLANNAGNDGVGFLTRLARNALTRGEKLALRKIAGLTYNSTKLKLPLSDIRKSLEENGIVWDLSLKEINEALAVFGDLQVKELEDWFYAYHEDVVTKQGLSIRITISEGFGETEQEAIRDYFRQLTLPDIVVLYSIEDGTENFNEKKFQWNGSSFKEIAELWTYVMKNEGNLSPEAIRDALEQVGTLDIQSVPSLEGTIFHVSFLDADVRKPDAPDSVEVTYGKGNTLDEALDHFFIQISAPGVQIAKGYFTAAKTWGDDADIWKKDNETPLDTQKESTLAISDIKAAISILWLELRVFPQLGQSWSAVLGNTLELRLEDSKKNICPGAIGNWVTDEAAIRDLFQALINVETIRLPKANKCYFWNGTIFMEKMDEEEEEQDDSIHIWYSPGGY